MREAIKRENINMDEVPSTTLNHSQVSSYVLQHCFQVDKRVLGTSEEKQAMPEEAQKSNQEKS